MMNGSMADQMAFAKATPEENKMILNWIDGWYGEPSMDALIDGNPGVYAVLIAAMRRFPGYYPKNDRYGGSLDTPIYGSYEEVQRVFNEYWGEKAPVYDDIIADAEHWILVPEGFIYCEDGYTRRRR